MARSLFSTQTPSTPWHLWLVGILALLWNGMGAMDYLLTQTRNSEYMAQFSQEQLAFFYGFPSWVVAAWAIAVWGGVLGAILLLMRRRLAIGVFLISLLAMVLTTVHNYLMVDGMAVIGDPFSLGFTATIFVVALLLYLYSKRLGQQGRLR
ncbi:conserved hypothetical protein [Ferrimonas balearica DSM 9799]|uniref:Sugar transporter n=1 Tax=Ferrimonas balearica (strain DSM 9799 / CCM 4581 / KCTC 23876 / PAT) TaxID=550540 RepID=E1ST79_FERBD|nr:membrane protein [Ferrimonas balearica]ADN76126.1 conserved hypothetical protein [Ferrimonas balearica DSM 9799]